MFLLLICGPAKGLLAIGFTHIPLLFPHFRLSLITHANSWRPGRRLFDSYHL